MALTAALVGCGDGAPPDASGDPGNSGDGARTSLTTLNVLAVGPSAFVARAEDGISAIDPATAEVLFTASPREGTGAVHDLASDGALLFSLDAINGGVQGWSVSEGKLDPVGPPVVVDVGPFSGIAASRGRVVVSGGTGELSVLAYDARGAVSGPTATIDLGIGQPDILLDPERPLAYVSTDFAGVVDGETFGITVLDLEGELTPRSAVGLRGAGFSAGTLGPANFPIESTVVGNVLLVAHGGGLSVIDTIDPDAATRIVTLDLGFEAIGVDAGGARAYVVSGEPSAEIASVDIQDPSAPRILAARPIGLTAGQATGVTLNDAIVLVSTTADGVIAIERASLP